eukprot:TRINITY_DN8387_c0_g1_i2.p2 TRINITY_DN8387_c0_g1~~TRINITY_DN8387_c0_g1_i2.p2  ORF type:complete len:101 (-),score=3.62 TRINITY_DN8387_c0_g1_i2:203-505(-)
MLATELVRGCACLFQSCFVLNTRLRNQTDQPAKMLARTFLLYVSIWALFAMSFGSQVSHGRQLKEELGKVTSRKLAVSRAFPGWPSKRTVNQNNKKNNNN